MDHLIADSSRFARLGLSVHITASFINPGVDNRTVLEIFNASQLTVALYPGTKICQMIVRLCWVPRYFLDLTRLFVLFSS